MEKIKIIISDDSATHRFLIREAIETQIGFFKSDDYQKLDETDKNKYIIEVSDGNQTLDTISEDINFLFLDINMPKDGLEVLEELRANSAYDNLVIIMLTSSDLKSEIELSKKLKANAFLLKPYNIAGWDSKFRLFNKVFINKEEVHEDEINSNFIYIIK